MPNNGILIIDCETVPSTQALAHPEAIARMAAKREQSPEMFASVSPHLARVVCVGMRDADTGRECTRMDGSLFPKFPHVENGPKFYRDEAAVLTTVNETIDKYGKLVTFAGTRFDLPLIFHRSVINGLTPSKLIAKALSCKPWNATDFHDDVRLMMSFGNSYEAGTLESYAIAYGLSNPKAGGDGSHVAELVASGDAAALATYCLGDVGTTEALWRKWGA